jgi:hypothetical protein
MFPWNSQKPSCPLKFGENELFLGSSLQNNTLKVWILIEFCEIELLSGIFRNQTPPELSEIELSSGILLKPSSRRIKRVEDTIED